MQTRRCNHAAHNYLGCPEIPTGQIRSTSFDYEPHVFRPMDRCADCGLWADHLIHHPLEAALDRIDRGLRDDPVEGLFCPEHGYDDLQFGVEGADGSLWAVCPECNRRSKTN